MSHRCAAVDAGDAGDATDWLTDSSDGRSAPSRSVTAPSVDVAWLQQTHVITLPATVVIFNISNKNLYVLP